MVVIIIIGVVYSLVIGSFDPKKSVKVTTLTNLKDALLPLWSKGVRVDLYIYDNCSKSALFINNEIKEDLEVSIKTDIFKDIKVYKTDSYGAKKRVEYPPVIIENRVHKVCFQYTIFPNSSNSSYIVKSAKKYYTFSPYFEHTKIWTNFDNALDYYLKKEYTKITIYE